MKVKELMISMAFLGVALMTSAAGCSSDNEEDTIDKWASLVNENKQDAIVDGNTVTYGSHTYTIDESASESVSVSFSNIPSGYTEFQAVYSALLGKSVEGTAAMIPMAMEIYARNNATGKKCIELLCGSENASTMIRSLQSKFQATSANDNDPYIQRYLPAALLKGAKPGNAYSPVTPYTVEIAPSVNAPQGVTGGTDTFLYILTSGGWDSYQRQVEILQKTGSDYCTVYNCPSVYTQCQNIVGSWGGLR